MNTDFVPDSLEHSNGKDAGISIYVQKSQKLKVIKQIHKKWDLGKKVSRAFQHRHHLPLKCISWVCSKTNIRGGIDESKSLLREVAKVKGPHGQHEQVPVGILWQRRSKKNAYLQSLLRNTRSRQCGTKQWFSESKYCKKNRHLPKCSA